MGDMKVTGSSPAKTAGAQTLDDQLLDILNNPRLSEPAKAAALEKAVAKLSELEKKGLYERLKDRNTQDRLGRQFHSRL